MNGICNLSLVDARRTIAAGELCPAEYVEVLVSRIETLNPRFHSLLEIYADEAISSARSLRSKRGKDSLPPLFGIPFLVKDIIDVEGRVTTCQSRASERISVFAQYAGQATTKLETREKSHWGTNWT